MRNVIFFALLVAMVSGATAQDKFTYKSQDYKDAVKRLATRSDWPKKDDFETYDEYFKRCPEWDSSIVFTYTREAVTTYYADDSSFSMGTPMMRNPDPVSRDKGWRTFMLGFMEKFVRSVPRTTTRGKKVKVKEYEWYECWLDSMNFRDNNARVVLGKGVTSRLDSVNYNYNFYSEIQEEHLYGIDVILKMPVVEARKFHENLTCAIQFRLKGYADAKSEREYIEPDIDRLTQGTFHTCKATAVVTRIVFFHKKTKDILLSIDF